MSRGLGFLVFLLKRQMYFAVYPGTPVLIDAPMGGFFKLGTQGVQGVWQEVPKLWVLSTRRWRQWMEDVLQHLIYPLPEDLQYLGRVLRGHQKPNSQGPRTQIIGF